MPALARGVRWPDWPAQNSSRALDIGTKARAVYSRKRLRVPRSILHGRGGGSMACVMSLGVTTGTPGSHTSGFGWWRSRWPFQALLERLRSRGTPLISSSRGRSIRRGKVCPEGPRFGARRTARPTNGSKFNPGGWRAANGDSDPCPPKAARGYRSRFCDRGAARTREHAWRLNPNWALVWVVVGGGR